jgi:hypothetical protein
VKDPASARNDPLFWLADFVERRISGHLDHNVANEVSGLIAPVGGIGKMAVDFSHFEHVNCVCPLEKVSQGSMIGILHLVLAGLGLGGMLQGNGGIFLD